MHEDEGLEEDAELEDLRGVVSGIDIGGCWEIDVVVYSEEDEGEDCDLVETLADDGPVHDGVDDAFFSGVGLLIEEVIGGWFCCECE